MELFRLVIPSGVRAALVAHARAELPNECCGFLAGRVEDGAGRATVYLPLVNELASPTAFRTEPRSVLAAFRTMRAAGTDVIAICHSHPTAAAVPSQRDLRENTYGPNIPWVIVGFDGAKPGVTSFRGWVVRILHQIIDFRRREPSVRAWWLSNEDYREASIL
jgi:proteasome lid subunit RPN8/RPN11